MHLKIGNELCFQFFFRVTKVLRPGLPGLGPAQSARKEEDMTERALVLVNTEDTEDKVRTTNLVTVDIKICFLLIDNHCVYCLYTYILSSDICTTLG